MHFKFNVKYFYDYKKKKKSATDTFIFSFLKMSMLKCFLSKNNKYHTCTIIHVILVNTVTKALHFFFLCFFFSCLPIYPLDYTDLSTYFQTPILTYFYGNESIKNVALLYFFSWKMLTDPRTYPRQKNVYRKFGWFGKCDEIVHVWKKSKTRRKNRNRYCHKINHWVGRAYENTRLSVYQI